MYIVIFKNKTTRDPFKKNCFLLLVRFLCLLFYSVYLKMNLSPNSLFEEFTTIKYDLQYFVSQTSLCKSKSINKNDQSWEKTTVNNNNNNFSGIHIYLLEYWCSWHFRGTRGFPNNIRRHLCKKDLRQVLQNNLLRIDSRRIPKYLYIHRFRICWGSCIHRHLRKN